jgi:type IV secretory pathway VirB2 component (pilin)
MRINSILAAVAAVSMAAAPAVAAPKPVGSSAASGVAPAGETVQGEQIRGGFLLPLAIIIAIILGVLLLTNDDEDPISA